MKKWLTNKWVKWGLRAGCLVGLTGSIAYHNLAIETKDLAQRGHDATETALNTLDSTRVHDVLLNGQPDTAVFNRALSHSITLAKMCYLCDQGSADPVVAQKLFDYEKGKSDQFTRIEGQRLIMQNANQQTPDTFRILYNARPDTDEQFFAALDEKRGIVYETHGGTRYKIGNYKCGMGADLVKSLGLIHDGYSLRTATAVSNMMIVRDRLQVLHPEKPLNTYRHIIGDHSSGGAEVPTAMAASAQVFGRCPDAVISFDPIGYGKAAAQVADHFGVPSATLEKSAVTFTSSKGLRPFLLFCYAEAAQTMGVTYQVDCGHRGTEFAETMGGANFTLKIAENAPSPTKKMKR